jgi:hypothetical protein
VVGILTERPRRQLLAGSREQNRKDMNCGMRAAKVAKCKMKFCDSWGLGCSVPLDSPMSNDWWCSNIRRKEGRKENA